MGTIEHLNTVTIPKIIDFVDKYRQNNNNADYDAHIEFMQLMFDISDEEASNVIADGIINGDGTEEQVCISEQIKLLFNMLLPDYELNKVEFKDDQQRKNFIDYD